MTLFERKKDWRPEDEPAHKELKKCENDKMIKLFGYEKRLQRYFT